MTNSEATTPVGEWIEWRGGENPVPGQVVNTLHRSGRETKRFLSDHMFWDHNLETSDTDIIAYRPMEDASGKAEKLAALLANTTPGGPDGSCMEWQGRVESAGYGVIHEGRKKVRVHRETLSLAKSLPEGLFALHHCDNRRCINPEHLFAGTKADNNRDMTAKGRLVVFRGEDRTTAKLTAEAVAYIHASSDSHKALGLRFGVDRNLIRKVRAGQAWAHCHPSRLVSAPAVVGEGASPMTDLDKAVERLRDEPGITLTIVAGLPDTPGSYAVRKWENHGLEPGTHRLVPLCLAEREVSALTAALSAKSAELEKAREALRSIARNTCCGTCREAALVARQALGETND